MGGRAGADWAWAEKEGCRALEMWGMVVVSWDVVVLAPPQRTKLPFGVHLMADTLTWVAVEQLSEALMVAQILAGGGLVLSGQVYAADSTTMLGHCAEAAFATYVGWVEVLPLAGLALAGMGAVWRAYFLFPSLLQWWPWQGW